VLTVHEAEKNSSRLSHRHFHHVVLATLPVATPPDTTLLHEWANIAAEEPDTRGEMAELFRPDGGTPHAASATSTGRFRRRSGWKRDNGLEAGLPRRNTKCRKATIRTARSLRAPRGSPRGANYQLKTGHARTGQYLRWARVRPTVQCWWCQCPSQTRDHLFKRCPEWKMQQKVLWAKV